MSARRLSLLRYLGRGAAALALAGMGCASPTLPLPPPAQPAVAITSPTTVHLTGRGVEGNALVIIVNRNPTLPNDKRVGGTEADSAGAWDADVNASSGDALEITQEFGATRSPPILVQIP